MEINKKDNKIKYNKIIINKELKDNYETKIYNLIESNKYYNERIMDEDVGIKFKN